MISLPTATKTPLPKVTSLKDNVFSVSVADPPTLLVTTTVLEPTATKMLLPYAAESKVFVTGEVKSITLLPLGMLIY